MTQEDCENWQACWRALLFAALCIGWGLGIGFDIARGVGR